MSSLTDGFVNALLLSRVAMITENYCKLTYIKSDRDLFPRMKVLSSTTLDLLAPFIDIIGREIKRLTWVKGKHGIQSLFNKLQSQQEIEGDDDGIESKKRLSKARIFKYKNKYRGSDQ